MSLVFDSLTISEWFHCAAETPRAAAVKSVAYASAQGRESLVLGGALDDSTSKTLIFSTVGGKLNWLRETAAATVRTKMNSIQTKMLSGAVGTLTFSSLTHTNMRLVQFRVEGDIRPVTVGSTTYYVVPFTAVFAEDYE